MWKAMQVLRREGTAGRQPSVAPVVEQAYPRLRCESLHDEILSDIRAGALPIEDPMPTVKLLCGRYRSGPAPLTDALRRLAHEGVLVRESRRYRVWRPTPAHSGPVVTLYAHLDESGRMRNTTPRSSDTMRAIEAHCVQQGVCLRVRSFDNALVRREQQDAIGCILWPVFASQEALDIACQAQAVAGRPLVIIDETGLAFESSSVPPGVTQWLRYADGASAGTHVAEHLLSLGHRDTAFVSVLGGDDPAVAARLEPFRTAMTHRSGTVVHLSAGLHRDDLESQMHGRDPGRCWAALRKAMAKSAPAGLYNNLLESAFPSVLAVEVMRAMEAGYARLVKMAGVTAWAFWNDVEAIAAVEWLKKKRVAVPRVLSLVGIDDSALALRNNLSSYNFNPQAVARAAVQHITGRMQRRQARDVNTVFTQIRGMVVQRTSSASCAIRR